MTMRYTIYFTLLLFAATFLFSCGESAKERQQREMIDSLEHVNYQTNMAYGDLQKYISIIAEGLDSISIEEHEIFFATPMGENNNRINKQRMKQQLAHVRELLARHRMRIDSLEQKLSNNYKYAKELQTIITSLKQQLEQKDRELDQLRVDLDNSKKTVRELRQQMKELAQVQEEQNSLIEEQQEKLQGQEEKINVAYVRIASKRELKADGLLTGGLLKKSKVDYSKLDVSLFQSIDIRQTQIFNISEKAKILTPVPDGSYTFVNGTLTITNPELFWSISNYLIIQTE